MNPLKSLAIISTLIFAFSAQASVIEYKGYSRDTSSNVVTGNGKEWLMWNQTTGKDINWFLNSTDATQLRSDGWQISQLEEITGLFNDFSFLNHHYDPNYYVATGTLGGGTSSETEYSEMIPYQMFNALFGSTWQYSLEWPGNHLTNHRYHNVSQATFLRTGYVGRADLRVSDEFFETNNIHRMGVEEHISIFPSNYNFYGTAESQPGLALFRNTKPSASVPEPSSIIIFLSGLLLMGLRIRSKA